MSAAQKMGTWAMFREAVLEGDADDGVAALAEGGGQALVFSAEDDGDGSGHGHRPGGSAVHVGADDADAGALEGGEGRGDALADDGDLLGAAHGDPLHDGGEALAALDRHDDGVDPGAHGAAQDGAEVLLVVQLIGEDKEGVLAGDEQLFEALADGVAGQLLGEGDDADISL